MVVIIPPGVFNNQPEDNRTVEQFAKDYQVDLDLLIASSKRVLANSVSNKTKAICHINDVFSMRKPLPLTATSEFVDRLLNSAK
ncbi:hypothetical protein [Vibrio parahaemolyticus]|uniref:hypothetical protein n=1 Tax=Vibrio parahaemolyticus TaxID=670 RepID=UPI001E43BD25|nr:hypothetical protein [Vibrio parahaemolyticus]